MNSGSLMPRPTLARRRVAAQLVVAARARLTSHDTASAGRSIKAEAAVVLEPDAADDDARSPVASYCTVVPVLLRSGRCGAAVERWLVSTPRSPS